MTRSSDPRLLIIDPSMGTAEEQGAAVVAATWPGPTRTLCPALAESERVAPDLGYDDFGAVVVLGSKASVHDDLPWLAELTQWVAPIVAGEVDRPLMGICFGHQLVAHVGGGTVGFLRPDESKLVDYVESRCTSSRWGEAGDLRVIASHRETVLEIPSGFETLGQRNEVIHDLIQHRERPILAAQFHPEAREQFAGRAGLDLEGVDDRLRADSGGLLRGFARVARDWLRRSR